MAIGRVVLLAIGLASCRRAVPTPVPATAAPILRPTAAESAASSPPCEWVTSPFTGTVCAPRDGRRHAAIVLFGGSQGGNPMRYTAQMFASRGYVAASVIYFGAPATPPTLVEVPVEIGGRAVQAVARRSDVDAAHVAVMGSSKGGEYALLVASTYPEVKAVIAYVPSPFAWFGLGVRGSPTACSWSRAGKALPCVAPDAAAGQAVWRQIQAHEEVAFRPSYDEARVHADADAMAAAFFPLERIQGPVLCLAGDDDQMWSSRIHCELALDYLRQHHHSYADRMVSYPNAGHLFIIAKGGPSSAMNSISAGSFKMLFGGTPAGDALAAQAAWAEIYAFLGAAFNPAAAAGMHDDR